MLWMEAVMWGAVRVGPDPQRGLTPLAWGHVNPYGTFRLDMTTRLPLDPPGTGAGSPQLPPEPLTCRAFRYFAAGIADVGSPPSSVVPLRTRPFPDS